MRGSPPAASQPRHIDALVNESTGALSRAAAAARVERGEAYERGPHGLLETQSGETHRGVHLVREGGAEQGLAFTRGREGACRVIAPGARTGDRAVADAARELVHDPAGRGGGGQMARRIARHRRDVENWGIFATLDAARGGQSSWYDFNFDGLTHRADLRIIERNFGSECRRNR